VLHFAAFLALGMNDLSGWDQAEVNRLEQNTFKVNDEIEETEEISNEQWIEDIKSQIYKTVTKESDPLTIADFD
jgi:hypothetical protein